MSMVEKLEAQVEIKSSAEKFHDVFSRRPHHVSNMTPNLIHGCDLHEGEFGKQGTVICWTYTHDGEKKIGKEIVEEIDDAKYSITFKVIEGDVLNDFKQFKVTIKATPMGEESVVHITLEYEKKKPETPHPNTLVDLLVNISKDIDAHLQNN